MAVSVKIDPALKIRIDNLASARDRSAHWIMREAIRDYVEREEARELLIPFGAAGYICLYRFKPREDSIYILAFRHQRDAGY